MKPSERIKQIKRELAGTLHGYSGPNEKLWHAISAVIAYLDEQHALTEKERVCAQPKEHDKMSMEWKLILLRGKKEPHEFMFADSRKAMRTALAWGSLYSAVVTMEAPREEGATPTITVDASLYFDGKLD